MKHQLNHNGTLGKDGKMVAIQCNYDELPTNTFYQYNDDYASIFIGSVAIFRLRHKVECDKCGECTKDTQDAAGNTYCQSCEENINEERSERWANDAENFLPFYNNFKRLK